MGVNLNIGNGDVNTMRRGLRQGENTRTNTDRYINKYFGKIVAAVSIVAMVPWVINTARDLFRKSNY